MTYQSHPKWKYAVGRAVIVQDEAEEAALDGEWFDLPEHLAAHLEQKARQIDEDLRLKRASKADADALDKQISDLQSRLDDADEEELPDLATLRTTATELGISFDGRTGAKKLAEQIKAAIEAQGE